MLMLELLSSSNWSQWHVSMLTTDSESGLACGALLWKYEECLQTLRMKSQKQCTCLLARMLKFGRVCGVNTEWMVSSGSSYVNEI